MKGVYGIQERRKLGHREWKAIIWVAMVEEA